MKKIGLTGGIGSGKSYIAGIFEALAVPVFYADDEAKKILNNKAVLAEVSLALGSDIADEQTGLPDRKKIAAVVFSSPEKLKALNQIIHPKVEQLFQEWCIKNTAAKYVIKEAAILFESGSYKNLDAVICVVSPLEVRMKRIAARDNTSETEILKRIKNQITDEERIAKSDWVIQNNDQDGLLKQVLHIHQAILDLK